MVGPKPETWNWVSGFRTGFTSLWARFFPKLKLEFPKRACPLSVRPKLEPSFKIGNWNLKPHILCDQWHGSPNGGPNTHQMNKAQYCQKLFGPSSTFDTLHVQLDSKKPWSWINSKVEVSKIFWKHMLGRHLSPSTQLKKNIIKVIMEAFFVNYHVALWSIIESIKMICRKI